MQRVLALLGLIGAFFFVTVPIQAQEVAKITSITPFSITITGAVGQYQSTYGPHSKILIKIQEIKIDSYSKLIINSIRNENLVDVNAFTYLDPETGMLTFSFTEAKYWKYVLHYTPQDGELLFGTLTNPVEEWTVRFNKI